MSAAEVNPFYLLEPSGELLLDMSECAYEHVRTVLAMAMAVETIYLLGQLLRQLVCAHSEACARRARVVYVGLNLRILRIDAQSETDFRVLLACSFVQTLVLSERVERKMA